MSSLLTYDGLDGEFNLHTSFHNPKSTYSSAAVNVKGSFLSPFLSKRISDYWPEFGQHGKEKTTIADLMRHEVSKRSTSECETLTCRPDSQTRDQWLQKTAWQRTSGKTRLEPVSLCLPVIWFFSFSWGRWSKILSRSGRKRVDVSTTQLAGNSRF